MASPTATSPGLAAAAAVHGVQAPAAAPTAPTLRRKQKRSHTAKKANRAPAPPADPRVQQLNRTVARLKAERAAKKVTEDNPRGDSTWNTDMNTHDKKIKDLRAEAHRQHEALHQSGHGDASKSAGAGQLWGLLGKKRVWKGEVIKGGRRKSRRRRRRSTRRKSRRHRRRSARRKSRR